MRRLRTGVFLAVCAAAAFACGLDPGGALDTAGDDGGIQTLDSSSPPVTEAGGSDDGGGGPPGPDSSTPTDAAPGAPDAHTPEAGIVDTGPPDVQPCTPTGTGDCFVVPGGWNLVAYGNPENTSCPSGFSQNPTNWFEGPSANGNLCACGACDVNQNPSCAGGPISVAYDFAGNQSCGLPGIPAQNSNNPPGSCGTDLYNQPLPAGTDLKLTPSGPQGGQCQSASQPQPQNVAYTSTATTCEPDSPGAAGCTGGGNGTCSPSLPAPFQPCIRKDGDQTCPGAPFTTKHLVGSDVGITCAQCGCSVTATCGGTMTLYMDKGCGKGALVVTVDGFCHSAGADGGTYTSYKYQGVASNVQCTTTPPANPPVTLNQPTTFCCPQ